MVGFTHRDQAEFSYPHFLQHLSDEGLQRELDKRLHLLKTTVPGPFTEDWKKECIEDELARREQLKTESEGCKDERSKAAGSS